MKEIKQFDVIVLGGGLAGIYTALNIRSDLKIGLFIKDKIDVGSSKLKVELRLKPFSRLSKWKSILKIL